MSTIMNKTTKTTETEHSSSMDLDDKLFDILSGATATASLPNAVLYSTLNEDIDVVKFLTGKLEERNALITEIMRTHANGECDPLPGVPKDESLDAFMAIEELAQSYDGANLQLLKLRELEKVRFMVGMDNRSALLN
jgi:hypothetical protein